VGFTLCTLMHEDDGGRPKHVACNVRFINLLFDGNKLLLIFLNIYIHLYVIRLRGTDFGVVLKNQHYKHKVVEISALEATFQFRFLPNALNICSIAIDPIKFSFRKFSMLITCILIEILIS
jgi:hypothetical protein